VTSALSGIAQAFGPGAPVSRPADVELEVAEPDATGPASNGTAYTAG